MLRFEEYFRIKDNCRKGLLPYLEQTIAVIPEINNPRILDAGCGTGVPTIYIAERLKGKIMAIDPDFESIAYLQEKVNRLDLSGIVTPYQSTLSDLHVEDDNQFDLIFAEGLLNVVGFIPGFLKLQSLLKRPGFMIIHDEHKDYSKKTAFMEHDCCTILDTIELDDKVWWRDYYQCLEREIASLEDRELIKLFKTDLAEIESYKKDASQFRSRYYVIQMNCSIPVPEQI